MNRIGIDTTVVPHFLSRYKLRADLKNSIKKDKNHDSWRAESTVESVEDYVNYTWSNRFQSTMYSSFIKLLSVFGVIIVLNNFLKKESPHRY